MIKNTFICDRCGSEHPMSNGSLTDDEQMVAIELRMNFGAAQAEFVAISKSATWCRTCVMRYGLKEPYNQKDKNVAPVEPPTFEEIFADLIERLGFERRQ